MCGGRQLGVKWPGGMGRWRIDEGEAMRRMSAGDGMTLAQLGWVIGVIGVVVGITGGMRSCRKDSDAAAREMATIVTSLEYLKKSVDSLGGQMTASQGAMAEIISRIGGVERSVARAHNRIDMLGKATGGSGLGGLEISKAAGEEEVEGQ